MDKILVTTDFSANSKAGLRFAIQFARQRELELTFFHSYYIEKPTSWSDRALAIYEKNEAEKILKKLNRFVDGVYKGMEVVPGPKQCRIQSALLTDNNIAEYAEEHKFSFICISTRGAGTFKKILGTNTSYLINHSAVPVIAVPHTYRTREINKIIYASDLVNLDQELKEVLSFSTPLKASLELLHFNYPTEERTSKILLQKAAKKFSKYAIKMHLEVVNLTESLISNMAIVLKKSRPSMVIMYTEQHRSFFDKIFLSSNSAEYSFNAKVPLLVFNKIRVKHQRI